MFEDAEGLHIELELPGVRPQDLAVTVSTDTIVVEAERTFARSNAKSVMQLEGRYGRMRRTFQLPVRSEPQKALAELRLGVLRIFVPRAPLTSTVTSQLELHAKEAPIAVPIG